MERFYFSGYLSEVFDLTTAIAVLSKNVIHTKINPQLRAEGLFYFSWCFR